MPVVLKNEEHPMRSTPIRAISLIVAMIGTAMASTVPAHAGEDSAKVRRACSGDAKRLCPTTKHGSEEQRYCMEAKQSYLSRGCGRALEDEGVAPRGYFTARNK